MPADPLPPFVQVELIPTPLGKACRLVIYLFCEDGTCVLHGSATGLGPDDDL